jgi:hypothetical protein
MAPASFDFCHANTHPVGGNRESTWIGPARRHALRVAAAGPGAQLADTAMSRGRQTRGEAPHNHVPSSHGLTRQVAATQ